MDHNTAAHKDFTRKVESFSSLRSSHPTRQKEDPEIKSFKIKTKDQINPKSEAHQCVRITCNINEMLVFFPGVLLIGATE